LNDPKDEEAKAQAKTVDKAMVAANKHIDQMHEAITNTHEPHNLKLVQEAFGRKPDFPQIAQNIGQLKSGHIEISTLNKPGSKPTSQASTNMLTGRISLKPGFYEQGKDHEYRGGILIHEATHALFGSHDYFSKDSGRPLGSTEADKRGNDKLRGYLHSADFEHLKKENSHNMHTNADSYTKLGRVVMDATRAARGHGPRSGQEAGPSHTSHGNIDSRPQEHVKKNPEPHTTAQDHGHSSHIGDPSHAGPSHTTQGHGQTPASPVTAKKPSPWQKVKNALKIGGGNKLKVK
jgi:hypothetical protein